MFIVIEMQTNGQTTSTLTYAFNDRNLAYQKFHTILAAASVSNVEIHTAFIVNEFGITEDRGTFEHRSEV